MNRFALIKNEVVQTVIETENTIDAFPDIINSLVECSSDVRSNWTYNSGVFAAPVIVLPDVTPRQMRQALILSGISIVTIENALDSLPEPVQTLARIEWEYSLAFQRNRPLVAQVGVMLGFSTEMLDAMWRLAASL